MTPSTTQATRRVALAYAVGVIAVLLAGNLAFHLLPVTEQQHRWPDHPIIEVLARWDTGWYFHIAEDGYFYDGPGRQSAVGFFPAYPALARILGVVVRDTIVAAVLISLASGLATFVALWHWAVRFFDRRAAIATLVALGTFPFAFYLFGVAYAESLFVAASVGAFLLLERDRPVLAGIVGALAVATRPVGVALVLGLAIRAAERRGWRPKPRDAGVLVAGAGFVVFCAYLAWRFGDPLAYTKVKSAAGWGQDVNRATLLKSGFVERWRDNGATLTNVVLVLHAVASVAAVALLPRVVRRLGWGYAAYTAGIVLIPLLTSAEFLAMGRYLLPAFPVFAVAAESLAQPERWKALAGRAIVVVNGAVMLWLASLFARWYLIS